jgi:deoxycytidylate deaminase
MDGEVLGLGCNEVPKANGGQYWCDHDPKPHRDRERGEDANEIQRRDCLREVADKLLSHEISTLEAADLETKFIEYEKKCENTRLMHLTEFGRAVHAEMEAILASGRKGVSVKEAELYTTTFPCHNCAKHIIGSGITNVVYIEPYPPSLAKELHSDAIAFSTDETASDKVTFGPFRGVAPRMYPVLFVTLTPDGLRLKRKKEGGAANDSLWGLRIKASPTHYINRETVVARAVSELVEQIQS